jgi:hypothetical protein
VSVRLITLTIVGFILGALAAGGVGVRVIREVRALDDATSLPAQNIARDDGYHTDPGETLISSVALAPEAATFGDNGFSITYEMTSIAPSLGTEYSQDDQPLYPKRWLVEALGGEFEGTQENANEPVAVFPLMVGGSIDQVDAVRIVEAFVPAPFETPVSISGTTPEVSVGAGIDVVLVGESDNGDTTTIEIRIVAADGIARDVQVVGDGPGWSESSTSGDTVTLTRSNEVEAAEFDLIVFGTSWVTIDGEFIVNIGSIDE